MRNKILFALALFCVIAIPTFAQDPSETRGPGAPTAQSPVPDCIQFKKYRDTLTGNVWNSVGLPCSWVNPPDATVNRSIPSGLIGWYPLSEATGVPPSDISGAGNNGSLPGGANNPTGTPQGFVFGGNANPQWFLLPAAINAGGRTYMAYLCQTFPATFFFNNHTFLSSTAANGPVLDFMGLSTGRADWSMAMGQNNVSHFTDTKSQEFVGGCHVYTWEIGPTLDRMFVDQTEVGYAAQVSSAATVGVGGTIDVGRSSQLTQGYFFGTARNLLVWNRQLTTSEVQQVTQTVTQLSKQAGVVNPSPAFGSVPAVECGIDSITAGASTAHPYCDSTSFTPTETVNRFNIGVNGQSMAGFLGYGPQAYVPNIASNAPHNTLVLFGCTNDFTENGTAIPAAATCLGMTREAARVARNYGLKVIVIPMISRTTADTSKNNYDTLLNANWQQFADGYISPTDALLWADGANSNLTYFQVDATHPTQAGQTLIGTYLTNAYNKLYGSNATSYNSTAAATYTLTAADSYLRVTANSTLTLPSCKGYSGTWTVKVNPGLTVTLKTAAAGETIDGVDRSVTGLSLTAGATATVLVVPSAPATATCTWQQTL
jgi:lysophospholipase L1-like esterase